MNDPGNLSRCMVEGDAVEMGRARLLRGKALAASLILETVVIAGVLLWPLATLGVLPPQVVATPVPIYHGEPSPRTEAAHQAQRSTVNSPRVHVDVLHQPPVIPAHVPDNAGPEPPSVDVSGDPALVGAPGAWVPGGSDAGRPVEIASPQTESKPRMVSIGVMDGSLIHRVEPVYPKSAEAIHLFGTVVLRATIGTDGQIHEIEIVRGNPILAEAARAAVRQWRYRPTLLDGQAVEVETQVTVNFVLQ